MRRLRNPARRLTGSERGETLVEFALTSVVFFVMILGILEFGFIVWRYNMVSDLAQEGARWASVRGKNTISPASWPDVQTYVNSRSLGMTVPVNTTYPAPSTLAVGETVTVEITNTVYPFTQLIPHGTMTLRNRAQMIVTR